MEGARLKLNLNLKQTVSLSPQMLQSMEILQMGTQELLEYIDELAQENPAIEVEENFDRQDEFFQMKRKLEWLEASDTQNIYYYKTDENDDPELPFITYKNQDWEDKSLYIYVKSQLSTLELNDYVLRAAEYITESLDSRGYLEDSNQSIAAFTGFSEKVVSEAVLVVQSLEPAGVGARNLSECLKLQLKRRKCENFLAYRIVEQYLGALGKNRYNYIARMLGASLEDVLAACSLIKSLNPRPGTGFASRENLLYINPDIFIVKFQDHFEVLTNDYYFPTININRYYQGLFRKTDEKEVREYLGDKIKKAKWVVKSIEQRKSTMLRCVECILDIQEGFFRNGSGHLVPMTLNDISRKLGIHESTVSRALRDKYVQCSSGVYPMSYFFSRALGNEKRGTVHSPDYIKSVIKELVEGENKKKPLSDNQMSEIMHERNLDVSRRTIAKYRDELGIANTVVRKLFD